MIKHTEYLKFPFYPTLLDATDDTCELCLTEREYETLPPPPPRAEVRTRKLPCFPASSSASHCGLASPAWYLQDCMVIKEVYITEIEDAVFFLTYHPQSSRRIGSPADAVWEEMGVKA